MEIKQPQIQISQVKLNRFSELPQGKLSEVKMFKLVEDPCFGKKFETHEQCPECWIKQSCFVCFRNRK